MHEALSALLFPDYGGELDHRSRLIVAMAQCLREGSYAAITIADVVRLAHVSKRTFYEHFADKEECYLATYGAVSETIMRRILEASARSRDPVQQLRLSLDAYLGTLDEYPALSRSFLAEIQAVGPRALGARREVHRRFAQLVQTLLDQGRARVPGARVVSSSMATALVGGINELLLEALESGEESLKSVAGSVFELIGAVLLAPPELDAVLAAEGLTGTQSSRRI